MEDQNDSLHRAIYLEDQGRCQEAIAVYEVLSKNNPVVLGSIGNIYHIGCGDVSEDLDKAISYYQLALDRCESVAISRSLLTAYFQKSFSGIDGYEEYLEKIAGYDHLVAQLACLWLFALLFRSERSPEEQAEGRAYGERAAQMGNVHARKAMAEVYFAERKLLRAAWMYSRALFSELRLRLVDPEDIRLQKY
jgi:TPR repeat protein